MAIAHNPKIVTDGLVLCLDAANPKSLLNSVEVLVVAGGGSGGVGSGGNAGGGGGGGGGVLTGSAAVTQLSYTITVGNGGAGLTNNTDNTQSSGGNQGQNSSAFGLEAIGGGRGKSAYGTSTTNASLGGGSGGGGSNDTTAIRGNATAGQGNIGGGGDTTNAFGGGGGGGGAGAAGASGTGGASGNAAHTAGAGGNGISSNISGSEVFYGGGGGGGQGLLGTGFAAGGLGGGGRGGDPGAFQGTANSEPGVPNSGGGSGGGSIRSGTGSATHPGGSGIVIIRYPGPQRATGGTVTSVNGDTVHSFTASGTFTPNIITDLRGNSNNGTLVNGVGYSGDNLGSLVFDGVDDYTSISNSNSLQFGGTFTINSWIFASSLSGRFGIFSTRFANPAGSWQLEVGPANGGTNRIAITGVGTWIWESASNVITTNTWYNICYVKPNNATQGGTIYLNGVQISPIVTTAYTISNNSSIKLIGVGTGLDGFFAGNIAQVSIYNRALTAQEVQQNYNALRGRYGI